MQSPGGTERSRIRVLPDHLANMIAAGEVIERPSAVVKELVENALDAGAMRVSVELVSGGRRLIRVSDDGCGMNGDDAVLCFERHATSKIADRHDLDTIRSYGFRGEALPSIASVAKVQLQTCPDEAGVGTEVIIQGGQLRSVRDVGRARGTTVVVRDLFFNTPARRKFLRTDGTELRHCVRELTGLGLGCPKLGFHLSHSGRDLLECHPVSAWQERAQSLFGREMLQRGVVFERTGEIGRVYGLLGRPGDAGGGYGDQYLLVNSRPVQSRLMRKAVLDGYEATLESGKQPFFLVFLELDPASVDVNVHPQKREVRFHEDKTVYQFVMSGVGDAFAETGVNEPRLAPGRLIVEPEAEDATSGTRSASPPPRSGVPHFWTGPKKRPIDYRVTERSCASDAASEAGQADRIAERQAPYAAVAPVFSRSPERKPRRTGQRDAGAGQLALSLVSREEGAGEGAVQPSEPDVSEAESHLWQFQQKYVFVSTRDGLWIIDQHVAHERILYEEAMKAFAGETPASQRILFPLTLELTPEQDAVLEEVLPMLESMGFGIRREEGRTITVDAYPGSAASAAEDQLIRQMIDDVAEVGFKRTGIKEQLAASYSCRAAIKAGEPLSTTKMRWLIERLFGTSMPYVCPHGRPIIVKIDMAEFDSRFGRE